MISGREIYRDFALVVDAFGQLEFFVFAQFSHIAGDNDELQVGLLIEVFNSRPQIVCASRRPNVRVAQPGEVQRVRRGRGTDKATEE